MAEQLARFRAHGDNRLRPPALELDSTVQRRHQR